MLNLEGGSRGSTQRAHKGKHLRATEVLFSGDQTGSFFFPTFSFSPKDLAQSCMFRQGEGAAPHPQSRGCPLITAIRPSTCAGRWEGGLSHLPEELGLGAPPAPLHHMVWVLAAGAGAGGMAPKLPFLPVLTENRQSKDTAYAVRQCVSVAGEMPVQTTPPFSARETQLPVSPYTPLLLQPSSAVAVIGPGSRMGAGWGGVGGICYFSPKSQGTFSLASFRRVRARATV